MSVVRFGMCNLFRAYVRCTKTFLFFPFPRRPARPDSIVTEESYNIVSHSVKGQRCAEFDEPRTLGAWASCRLHWLETLFSFNLVGIVHHANINEFPGQPLFANTDMAENWHQLGFIVQRPSYGLEPIFVETQRGDIPRKSETIHPKPQSPEEKVPGLPRPRRGGPLILPVPDSPEHNIDNVHSLRKHLQTGMAIELATIPLYLFRMYSVKIPYVDDPMYYDPVIGAIRGPLSFIVH